MTAKHGDSKRTTDFPTRHHPQPPTPSGLGLRPDYICKRLCPLRYPGEHFIPLAKRKPMPLPPGVAASHARGCARLVEMTYAKRDLRRAERDPATAPASSPPPTDPDPTRAQRPRWDCHQIALPDPTPTADTPDDADAARPAASAQPPRHTTGEDDADHPTPGPKPTRQIPKASYRITPSSHTVH